MDFDDVLNQIEDVANEMLDDLDHAMADECQLDPRCGSFYIGEDFIASKYPHNLDEYAGFKTIDSTEVSVIGFLKIYSATNKKVAAVIKAYNEN